MIKSAYYSVSDNAKSLFSCYGSFGDILGTLVRQEGKITSESETYRLTSVYDEHISGVTSRCDIFENISDRILKLNRFKSRFIFEGGEYEVYTQFNTWQNESTGLWQPLNTTVLANGGSTRTTQDAVPFIAIWNIQANRGFAFHLLPNSIWEMRVSRIGHNAKYTKILVELGISDYNFDIELNPGDKFEASEILFYEIKNKQDLDCHKLHKFMNAKYPRRKMPIVYNTWMSRFDDISYEKLVLQAERASELGAEYFVIDAGWFGDGKPWFESVGDWVENRDSAMCGRMKKFSDLVRELGMRFGLWLEPERAVPTAKSVAEHPDFYLKGDAEPEFLFLDFANREAREWIFGVVSSIVDKYGIEFIKDDYNADLCFDLRHSGFSEYHKGYEEYIKSLRKKYPSLYISCCGSGGERMELRNYTLFDSFWPSDNQSPYTQLRIYKDTILRMPPQGLERWITVHSSLDNEKIYKPFLSYNGTSERLIACGDAVWHNVVGVQPSFVEKFTTAGPVGFSCDLTKLSDESFGRFKQYIKTIKEEREHFVSVSARILADTESILAIQYNDESFDRITIHVFTHNPHQSVFAVYPVLDEKADYIFEGQRIPAAEIFKYGISKNTEESKDNWHEVIEFNLAKCK